MIKKGNIEAGRSFVEMLGTLAIMAVLSIGAIAGFNYAMNKHRANELLDEARKRAYTVMTQTQLGLTRSLGEYSRHNTFAGGTFGSDIVTEGLTGRFGLKVTGVKKAVCQNLVDSIGLSTPLRWVATGSKPSVEIEGCADEGDYILVYNNSLTAENAKPCKTDSDCGECGTCNSQGGICHYPERDTKRCPTATPYCQQSSCDPCPDGQFQNANGSCSACDSPGYNIKLSSPEYFYTHCRGIRVLSYRDDQSYIAAVRCDYPHTDWLYSYRIAEADCLSCSQRYWRGGICYYCAGKVTGNGTDCQLACDNENTFFAHGECFDCNDPTNDVSYADETQIRDRCQGIRFVPWQNAGRRCDDTSEPASWMTSTLRSDCLSCPQRYMPGTGIRGMCYYCAGTVSSDGTSCITE